jgi:uncharacterized protein (TIGR00725 family)
MKKPLPGNRNWSSMMTDDRRSLRVSVAGSASAATRELEIAEETGRLLAEEGAVLICGGLGGVMEAACRGASAAGGITVGILPGSDPDSANPYVSIPIATGLGEARNAIVAAASDALIAIGGKLGTLSEIALALRRGIPVVGLETWELDEDRTKPFKLLRASTPAEAVKLVCKRTGWEQQMK